MEFTIEEVQDHLRQTPEAKQYGPTRTVRPLKLSPTYTQGERPILIYAAPPALSRPVI